MSSNWLIRTSITMATFLGVFAPDIAAAADANGRIVGSYATRPGVALPQNNAVFPQASGVPVNTGISQPGSGTSPTARNGQPPHSAGQKPHVTKQVSRFIHPLRGFQLMIPSGVAVHQRGEEKHIAMRSPTGYVMNIQTGTRNDQMTLDDMLARLESRYLGAQGPWQKKVSSRPANVAGLPGLDAQFQGHSAKTRVIVARGAKTDFVFTFVSPNDLYGQQERTFEWVLANFKPNPADLASDIANSGAVSTKAQLKADPSINQPGPVRAAEQVASFATGRPPKPSTTPSVPNMQRFGDPGYGFLIDYPKDWNVTKPTAFTATFSGPSESPAFDAVISVQNVRPDGASSADQSATIATSDLLTSLAKGTDGLTVLAEGNLEESPGSQFVARYQYSGETYRKWAVVVPRPEGEIAHIWSYTAPDAAFEVYQPVAESMLRSWTLTQ